MLFFVSECENRTAEQIKRIADSKASEKLGFWAYFYDISTHLQRPEFVEKQERLKKESGRRHHINVRHETMISKAKDALIGSWFFCPCFRFECCVFVCSYFLDSSSQALLISFSLFHVWLWAASLLAALQFILYTVGWKPAIVVFYTAYTADIGSDEGMPSIPQIDVFIVWIVYFLYCPPGWKIVFISPRATTNRKAYNLYSRMDKIIKCSMNHFPKSILFCSLFNIVFNFKLYLKCMRIYLYLHLPREIDNLTRPPKVTMKPLPLVVEYS